MPFITIVVHHDLHVITGSSDEIFHDGKVDVKRRTV